MKLTFMTITEPSMIQYLKTSSSYIFNLCSMITIGKPITHLLPYENIFQYVIQDNNEGDENSILFDKAYANQLMYDELTFIDLINLMITLEKYGEVIVLTNYENPYVSYAVESLIKFIQERYGVQSYLVNFLDDIDEWQISEFSQQGYMNYIQDVDRYKAFTPIEMLYHEGDADEQYNTTMG